MENNKKILTIIMLTVISMTLINCEYDVAQPRWQKNYESPAVPKITSVLPADSAVGGDNYITIYGNNFADVDSNNLVYFDNVSVGVVAAGSDYLTVRRPNISAEGIIIKLVSYDADQVAKYDSPYRVTQVYEEFGGFLENLELSAVTIDEEENIYVVEAATRNLIKSNAEGDKTNLGTANRNTTDMAVGPDGNVYLFGSNRAVDVVDVVNGGVERWTRLPSGKMVQCGDFSDRDFLYAAGRRTGIVIVKFNDQSAVTTDYFENDEITGIRAASDYVYVHVIAAVPDENTPEYGLWRLPVKADGNLDAPELIADLSGQLPNANVTGMYADSDGNLFIASNSENPMVVISAETGNLDYFYKAILPPYCKDLCWGDDNYAYMLCGDNDLGETWTIYRVDMGTN